MTSPCCVKRPEQPVEAIDGTALGPLDESQRVNRGHALASTCQPDETRQRAPDVEHMTPKCAVAMTGSV